MTEQKAIAKKSTQSIMMIVGDVSADRHASLIVDKLGESNPALSFWGIGGDGMKDKGVELLYHLNEFTSVGIVEVIKYLPHFWKVEKELLSNIESRSPDLILMVDFGTFNLRISEIIRKKFPKLPIVYFISPQVWASRPWRINSIKRNTSKMLVIFPFEESLYKEKNIPVKFVGHPLLEQIPSEDEICSRSDFFEKYAIQSDSKLISIFPGSRKQEIKSHTPVLIQSITELLEERNNVSFVISVINDKVREVVKTAIERSNLKDLLGKKVFLADAEDNHAAMNYADLVWAKSGTTTLEVAMFAKPMLIFYRGNWLSYFIVLLFKTIKNVGLPNLLAQKKLVPELLQLDCCAREFVKYTNDLLDVPGLATEIKEELTSIRDQMGKGNYISNCTEEILKHLPMEQRSSDLSTR